MFNGAQGAGGLPSTRQVRGWHYLSNATCLTQASFVACVVCRVKDHHDLLHYSQLLKSTCVRHIYIYIYIHTYIYT